MIRFETEDAEGVARLRSAANGAFRHGNFRRRETGAEGVRVERHQDGNVLVGEYVNDNGEWVLLHEIRFSPDFAAFEFSRECSDTTGRRVQEIAIEDALAILAVLQV